MRELVVLGTASQVPTRERNPNACFLRWDEHGILLDPGEGAQRQLTLAGIPVSAITMICITHFHGDHCLGLPGIIQRLSLDRVAHPVDVYFPAGGLPYFDRLRNAAAFHDAPELVVHPLDPRGAAVDAPAFRLIATPLDHRGETLGYRLEEPARRRMLPDRLEPLGIRGPEVGRLVREGTIGARGRTVAIEEVSEIRPGQRFAFVMDTRLCDGAFVLAEQADLLVCESTYLSAEEGLATEYRHLTAAHAARIAAEGRARRLVLSHYSQRHPDESEFEAEASTIFPDAVAARDLSRFSLPRRRSNDGRRI
ncbi:MAG: ribonuclease Z [Actinomycetota bacterium]